MKPFILTYKKEFLKGEDPKKVLEYFKSEFKKESDPDKLMIKNNVLLIGNTMPYKKSMQLINNIDQLKIVYYSEGMIEYKIYLYGFYVIAALVSVIVGIFLNNIIIAILIFSILYLINFIVIRKHNKFMDKKIKELNARLIGF